MDLLKPVSNVKIVDREKLVPNDYNPNTVTRDNLDLLKRSILVNGWTLPIVVKPDYTIVDGFHRWMVAGEEPLASKLGGKVPVVIVEHDEESESVYGTITHNRARGTHLLEPMKKIVQRLLDEGKSIHDVSKELGMKTEEIFRLSEFSREEFLKILTNERKTYNKAQDIKKV